MTSSPPSSPGGDPHPSHSQDTFQNWKSPSPSPPLPQSVASTTSLPAHSHQQSLLPVPQFGAGLQMGLAAQLAASRQQMAAHFGFTETGDDRLRIADNDGVRIRDRNTYDDGSEASFEADVKVEGRRRSSVGDLEDTTSTGWKNIKEARDSAGVVHRPWESCNNSA